MTPWLGLLLLFSATTPDRPGGIGSARLILLDPVGRPAPMDACEVEACRALVELLDKASATVDFAIYGMRGQTAVMEALERAKGRGVRLRGIVDRDVEGVNYYKDTEDLVRRLGVVRDDHASDRRAASQVQDFGDQFQCERPEGFLGPPQCLTYDLGDSCLETVHASREALGEAGDIMHNKFFIVDGRYVWTGSTNVSDSGTGGYNANLVTVTDSVDIARWYGFEFEQMYTEDKFHNEKISQGAMRTVFADGTWATVHFSPQDKPATREVRKLLQRAEKRIDVGIFFLTHKEITRDLIQAHLRGVKVRVIMDATAAKNGYAKHEVLRAAGIPVKIETWGGKMHMKSCVIDDDIVVTGSMNWTSAGEWGNDENTIVLHGRRYAEQYTALYEKMWASIPDAWLQGRPDPESQVSTTACTDRSDNDFDHLKDAEDPGCGPNPPPMEPLPGHTIHPKSEDGRELVRAVVQPDGRREYYPLGWSYQAAFGAEPAVEERWFCSEKDAEAAGWRRARKP